MNKTSSNKPSRPTIALLVDGLIEDYEVKVWSGVREAAAKHDFNLLCFACGSLDSPHLFSSQRNILLDLVETAVQAGHIDGIIALSGALANFSTPEKLLKTYSRFNKVPLVSVGVQLNGIPSITTDNVGGMRDMVSHLINHHGKRRIAFIRGPEHSHDAQERFEAYKRVLKECSLPFDPQLIAPGDFLIPSGERAVALFMDERKVKFDALVGANDGMAIDAMKALLARGVSIPEQIAVAGFDDAREARNITPRLSSVQQPGKELGMRATGLLAGLLQGNRAQDQNLLATQLIYRESCGCVVSKAGEAGSRKQQAVSGDALLQEALPHLVEECRKNFSIINETLGNERWLDELIQALRSDLENGSSSHTFLGVLKGLVAKGSEHGLETLTWTELLYLIFNRLAPYISPENPLPRLAFLVMNQLTQSTEALRRTQHEEQTLLLYRSYQRMITSLNMETMREIEGYAMPHLQINNCYISTYADQEAGLQGNMRPVIALEDGKSVLAENRADFPAEQILPGGGLKKLDKRFSFAVYALFLEHDQIGYAVYDMSRNLNSSIYEVLTGQLSSVLKGSALLDEVKNHAKNLEALVQERTADLQKKTQEVERLNEELVRKNKIDSLTTLYNRGAFFDFMRGEINRMRRMHQRIKEHHSLDASFCIMMVDIDHFKQINDTYGHLVGDRVLKQIGELLNSKSIFRREDVAGRFGGEEFIIELTNTTVEKAMLPARRLMDTLARIDFEAENERKFKVTISIGLSQYYADDPNEEAVINRADKALYHAKDTGRNKIVIYEETFTGRGE